MSGPTPPDDSKETPPKRPVRKRPVRKRPLRKCLLRKRKLGARKRPVRKRVPRKPKEMPAAPWEGPVPSALRRRFAEGIEKTVLLGGQKLVVASLAIAPEIVAFLKDAHGFDYLVDVTAVHWPKRERQFDLVWILYSFSLNERVRLKATVAEGEAAPSVVPLYSSADWLEREVYDMFGIEFQNHPDLRRILMPDEWEGFPLRRDYGILQQDGDWVRENLKIESAQ